ncbi:HAD family phosphatase [Candidatus Saccharibacteria bacterium]|nr:HAD family phosphatase [Candidatus Saccharibacteria bacterium]
MIKAVVFDCFGVLVGQGYWTVYRKLGGDLERDGAFLDSLLDKVNLGKITSDQLAMLVSGRLGISIDAYRAAMRADQQPNLEVFDYIRELKPRYKIGMLSNVTRASLEQKVPKELLDLFDVLVLSGEAGLLKPDPAIYRLAAERLGVKSEEIVFTDDHEEYVNGARAAGMHAILFRDLTDFKRQFMELTKT